MIGLTAGFRVFGLKGFRCFEVSRLPGVLRDLYWVYYVTWFRVQSASV